ncbi:hypothetical protein V1477_015765 [Vespula maculifrons]|uniref:Uncharacterized protein n=1 Tax=Vespula maculifrons TaxID=7453 RepID=A0ABD2BB38_VESMC
MDIEKKRKEKLQVSMNRNNCEFTAEYAESVRKNVKCMFHLELHGRNFRQSLKNAAIRSAILAHHKILTKRKYFRPRSHLVEVAAVGDPRANGVSTLNFA